MMGLYQRAAKLIAREGFAGVRRWITRKCSADGKSASDRKVERGVEEARAEHQRLAEDFRVRVAAKGLGDLRGYYWYHTVDLGDGLVTPGDYDFRKTLAAFHFPDDMHGMNVLDVGSATGFFAFEFEKRGARVVSVDLPSLADWDVIGAERDRVLRQLREYHRVSSIEEATHCHLHGPFEFCRKALGSRVERCLSSIYDLTPAKLGGRTFDLVFAGDVLLHLFSPLKALDALASLCRGTLIVATDLVEWHLEKELAVSFYLGRANKRDNRSWWLLNRTCLEEMLRRVGFADLADVGRHRGVDRGAWTTYDRFVFHARK